MKNIIRTIKEFFERLKLWFLFVKNSLTNEEILFIDALYTQGVESYRFENKRPELYMTSKHYRKGWDDFHLYVESLGEVVSKDRKKMLHEYTTGVSVAYVYGSLAHPILNGQVKPTPHILAGFNNAIKVMNKQLKLLKTDETVKRIKTIDEGARERVLNVDVGTVKMAGHIVEKKVYDGTR